MIHPIKNFYQKNKRLLKIKKYLWSGRKPWSPGYEGYRNDFILQALHDANLLDRFRQNQNLPDNYGVRLDERVVEYPWVLSRLKSSAENLLDAGSALNHEFILALPILNKKSVFIYNLSLEGTIHRQNVSYLYGDLRQTNFKDNSFDAIVCISTLEHVGLDNTKIYTNDNRYREAQPEGYRQALKEFRRLLIPGGRLWITVPYGRYQNFGWWQQFDRNLITDIVNVFNGTLSDQAFYRYTLTGWQLSNDSDCADCEYFDIHEAQGYDADYAAAARALACLELVK